MARKNTTTSTTSATASEQAKAHQDAVNAKIAHEKNVVDFQAGKAAKRDTFLKTAFERGATAGKGSRALTDLALDWQLEMLTGLESGMSKADAKEIYLAYADGHNATPDGERLATDDKTIKPQVSKFGTFALPAALHLVGSQHRVDMMQVDAEGNAVTMTVYDAIIRMVQVYGTKELAGGVYTCMAVVNRAANKLLAGSETAKAKAALLEAVDLPWIYQTIAKAGGKAKTELQRYDSWLKEGEKLSDKILAGYAANEKLAKINAAISALRGELAAEIEALRQREEAEEALRNRGKADADDASDDDADDADDDADDMEDAA